MGVETVATGAGIRAIARLRGLYGRGRWRKRKGVAEIKLIAGIVMGGEIACPATGSELGQRFGTVDLKRRFTNVFIFEKGAWHFPARQASAVERPCK